MVNCDVDEIIIVDIEATKENRVISASMIDRVARHCFVPLTVGGGIRTLDQVRKLLKVGVDKISVNSLLQDNPNFVSDIANKYGSQFVTVSIDAKKVDGGYMAMTNSGTASLRATPAEIAHRVEAAGAGEIFVNSVDRDGSRQGYDIDLLKSVSEAVTIPVIACGGVGRAGHLAEAITLGGCQAAAAANIFNHTELSTIAGKSIMKKYGLPIRIDSKVKYEGIDFDFLDRPV